MGGRGTFAAGLNVPYRWETVDKINGVKVLNILQGKPKLPEEAHSSMAYLLLTKDGVFKAMRFYDKDHYLTHEIGYHPEARLNKGNRVDPILHLHTYDKNFHRTDAVRIHKNSALYKKIKPYLRKVKL